MSEKRLIKNLSESKQAVVLLIKDIDPNIIFSGSMSLNYLGIIDRVVKDIDLEVHTSNLKDVILKLKKGGFVIERGRSGPDTDYVDLGESKDEVLAKITQIPFWIEKSEAYFNPKLKKVITHSRVISGDIFVSDSPSETKTIKFCGEEIKISLPSKIFKAKKAYVKNYEEKYPKEELEYYSAYRKHKADIEAYNKWKFKNILKVK